MTSRREDEVRRAREQLIAQGLLRAAVPQSLVTEEIEQSWRRSVSCRIDPDASPRIVGEVDPDSAILRAAGRILDQWQVSLEGSRTSLFLADEDGQIVSRRIGSAEEERVLDRAYAVEGFDFSEQSLGTNGLGTTIEARNVVFVRGAEHFNDALSTLACAGAPVKHPITGRIVGSLALASHVDAANPLMVAMARQAAQQIADALESMADARDLNLARAYRRLHTSRHPVLVMNSTTVMTDLPALSHVDAEVYAELWENLRRHRWDGDELRIELPILGTEVMVQRFGPAGQAAIFGMEFIKAAEAGTAAVVSAAESQGWEDGAGRHATVDSPRLRRSWSSPYVGVQRQLTTVSAAARLVDIVGGRGAGKCYQAAKWLRHYTGREPFVVTAQELTVGESVWDSMEEAFRDGHGIVVRRGERLSGELRRRLDDFTRIHRSGDSKVRVIVTNRTGDSRHPANDAGTESATDLWPREAVHVPSLADLRDNLLDVIAEVAEQCFPGSPPRFSSAALQRMLTSSWSGNVSELIEVLAALPEEARARGVVRTQDLPVELRGTIKPSLSRYEQSERDAIESALLEAGGNKSCAAEILGIGRTTLYRKMRTLKVDACKRSTSQSG